MTIKAALSNNQGMSGNKAFERVHNGPSGGGYSYPGPMYPPYHPPPSYHAPPPPMYHAPPPPMYHGPPAPPPVYNHYSFSQSKGKGGGGGGGGAALSALTLLSFLFFLNILQQCLKDQMTSMNPQVMVMSSSRDDAMRAEKPNNMKEPEKVYTLIDGTGRVFPEHPDDKHLTKVKIVKVNSHGDPIRTETVFVNAMTDGIGEIINDK